MRSESIGSQKSTPRQDAALSNLVSPVPEVDQNVEGRAGWHDSEIRQGGTEKRDGDFMFSAENTSHRAGGTETCGKGFAADLGVDARASGPSTPLSEAAAARSSASPERAENSNRKQGGNGKGRRVREPVTKDSDLRERLL